MAGWRPTRRRIRTGARAGRRSPPRSRARPTGTVRARPIRKRANRRAEGRERSRPRREGLLLCARGGHTVLPQRARRRRSRRRDQPERGWGPRHGRPAVGEDAADRDHHVVVVDVRRAVGMPLAVGGPSLVALAVLVLVGAELVSPVFEARADGGAPRV